MVVVSRWHNICVSCYSGIVFVHVVTCLLPVFVSVSAKKYECNKSHDHMCVR